MNAWSIADAKSKFSELVDRSKQAGPQTITRNGRPTAVVVSIEEWERRTRRVGTLVEFFAASPLVGADLDLERVKSGPRDIDL